MFEKCGKFEDLLEKVGVLRIYMQYLSKSSCGLRWDFARLVREGNVWRVFERHTNWCRADMLSMKTGKLEAASFEKVF